MNKKLRLLVTANCHNRCPLCCNKQFNFEDIPVVDRWDYNEIMITGGEPFLYPERTEKLCRSIRDITEQMGMTTKIYIYTAKAKWYYIEKAIRHYADGIVVAPHSKDDIAFFRETNNNLLKKVRYGYDIHASLRLKVFTEVKDALPENLKCWQVQESEWIENCPLPEGEDFRRVSRLWTEDKW